MYEKFQIKNFRCFADLTISTLKRVNLIAGKNNVGKTAVLEALWLHLGRNNPSLPTAINVNRGLQYVRLSPEDIWRWDFYQGQLNKPIELLGTYSDETYSHVRIALTSKQFVLVPTDEEEGLVEGRRSATTESGAQELILETEDSSGEKKSARVWIDGKDLKGVPWPASTLPQGIFLTSAAIRPKDDVERFSELEVRKTVSNVVQDLRLIEPRLQDLRLVQPGPAPVIHADVGLPLRVPLPLLGDGTSRLLSILLAIASAPRGAVLVDEIENGLHYTVLPSVWRAIGEAARRSDVQVFATTHSWECICAAHEAFGSAPSYDFGLHRLDRHDSDIRAQTYSQETLGAAISAGFEVR
ncbi:MAG: AAA family ATPase [Candidatus Hydrogenedentes bacterium]|nr:AAA family ATPase [Candidatus Hydrogenedentota bacterium]